MLFPFFLFNFLKLLQPLLLLDNYDVFIERVNKMLSHLLVRFQVEFIIIPILVKMAMKRSFQSIAVHNIHFSGKNYSSRFSLASFVFELAGVKSEF